MKDKFVTMEQLMGAIVDVADEFETSADSVFDLVTKIYSDEEVVVVPVVKKPRKKHGAPRAINRARARKKAQKRMKLEKQMFPMRAEMSPDDFQMNHYGRSLNHARFDHFCTRPYLQPYMRQTNTNWGNELDEFDEGESVWE